MYINGHYIKAQEFAFDGCHKIYLINTPEDKEQLTEYGYDFFAIEDLPWKYDGSCDLKFISNADLQFEPVPQGQAAVFN